MEQQHVVRLTQLEGPLPPILVDRLTLQVIDGRHRLFAALLKGETRIEVEFFDGSTEEAFLRSVEANVVHGLPLSQADRQAAATRIVRSHPHMSDRAIARASGLGAKTVAAIRRRSTDSLTQLSARVGRDGRVRPVSSEEGRRRAADVLEQRPGASLREVARLAGVSPTTVSDVRRRLRAGEPALPSSLVEAGRADKAENSAPIAMVSRSNAGRQARHPVDAALLLDKLVRDPSLRQKEQGRQLLRLLQRNAIETQHWSELTAAVPSHCGNLVVNLARQFADTWMEFAQKLDDRSRVPPERALGD